MKYLLLCQLSVLFKGPGWTPGMPRLGDPADLPEVLSHVAGSRVNIVCKLQWQDNEREEESRNAWHKSHSYFCFMHNFFTCICCTCYAG